MSLTLKMEDMGHEPKMRAGVRAGKGKEMDCSTGESGRERRSPAHTLISLMRPCQTPDLQNWEMTRVCCFKLLNLWSLVTAAIGNQIITVRSDKGK